VLNKINPHPWVGLQKFCEVGGQDGCNRTGIRNDPDMATDTGCKIPDLKLHLGEFPFNRSGMMEHSIAGLREAHTPRMTRKQRYAHTTL
jgi:hypothetical protein